MYIVLFFNSHSKYREMHCYRKSLACPKAAPLLPKGQSSPESTQGRVIALLLCKLCNPNFFNLRLNTCFFLFYFEWSAIMAPLFIPQLEMYEGFWSPGEVVEVWRQPGLTCTLKLETSSIKCTP